MGSFGLKKLSGISAGGLIAYMADPEVTLSYYSDESTGAVFDETWGSLGESLGLERGLTREQFGRLFLGQHPDTGEQLAHTNGYVKVEREDGSVITIPKRTPAIDTRLAVRKSVSELMVRAKDNPELQAAIVEVVKQAAKAAFEVMQREAKVARVPVKTAAAVGARPTKMQGGDTERVAAELLAVPVIGLVARPTEETVAHGAPGDPHLHVHMPVFTLCKVGERYYTADSYGLMNKRIIKHVEAVFDGEVARGLESLGIRIEYRDWDTARNGEMSWDVADSNAELCRHWSSNSRRKWKIQQDFEATYGRPMNPVDAEKAMDRSRFKKSRIDKQQDSLRSVVWERWWSDAKAHGLEPVAPGLGLPLERDPYEALGVLHHRLMSANGLCRENAVFTGAEIRPAVARCAVGLGFSPEELDGYANALVAQRAAPSPSGLIENLVPVRRANDPDHAYWTTRAVLAAEQRIAEAASFKAREILPHPDELTIARSIKSAGVKLDREQIRGVELVCSGSGWVNITGLAGTGKTSLLKAAVAAYRHEQQHRTADSHVSVSQHQALSPEIVVVSMVAKTAADTGRKTGADRWGSVESIVRQIEGSPGKLEKQGGKFKPTKDTIVIVEEAGQLDTLRMDSLLKAVGPARIVTVGDDAQLTPIGAGGWYQDQLSQIGGVELTMVRRQKDPRDVSDYQLIRQGRAPEALRNLDQRGRVHISEDRAHRVADVLMDYQDHRKGWRAQDIRIIADTSNADIDTCNRFIQRDRVARNEVGSKGFEVHDTDQDRRWTLRENDQVIFLKAHFVKGQVPVKNGTEGVVLSIDNNGRARVRIPDGDGQRIVNVRLNPHEQSQPLGLAYAVHANKYQGAEVPIALVMPGMGQTNANSAYSMVTRSTHETHVYASVDMHGSDPIASLGKAWSEREIKQSALSKLSEIRRQEYERPQREAPRPEPERVELYEVPELEEIELDPVASDPTANALARLRSDQERVREYERPAFEREYLDRDLDRGFGLDR